VWGRALLPALAEQRSARSLRGATKPAATCLTPTNAKRRMARLSGLLFASGDPMIGLAEFIADALGLLCAMASWTFIFILPIGFFALAQISGTSSPLLAAAESLIGISIGLLALWLANGVLKRGRVRMALTCLLCLFVGLRKIVASLNGPALNTYVVAQAFLAALLFFAVALFLGVILFRKREVET
jgi:uncharacterized membrane protein